MCEGVLGTVDQLLIDNCLMSEVRNHKRNLVVAHYNYQKAYDKVHHDSMTIIYRWMGFPGRVVQVIEQLMCGWKPRLEVTAEGKKRDKQMDQHMERISSRRYLLTSKVLSR